MRTTSCPKLCPGTLALSGARIQQDPIKNDSPVLPVLSRVPPCGALLERGVIHMQKPEGHKPEGHYLGKQSRNISHQTSLSYLCCLFGLEEHNGYLGMVQDILNGVLTCNRKTILLLGFVQSLTMLVFASDITKLREKAEWRCHATELNRNAES